MYMVVQAICQRFVSDLGEAMHEPVIFEILRQDLDSMLAKSMF